ncbi:MAG: S-layer homology domain-containing protein, partial [Clostridia bacterium]|nr:S-layer homology domain-containing protein [Clostridia bacterium]
MKKTTRILSLFITLAMIITMAVPMTVSAAFTDVDTNHNYYEAINNLSAEGILNGFEDGSFKPGDPVTRAQFTKIICYALSVGELSYSEAEKSIFTDVAPVHWAANNIVTAYRQGIINGMGDGTFAPEANVNYEQAVKMVVCALGYTEQNANNLGGYPYGYLSIANSNKIIAGITDCKIGEAMNRGAVAKLIDNMLNAEQVDDDGMGTGGSIRDEVSTSKKVNGQLIAGYGVALYSGTNPCYKNQIELGLGGDPEDNLYDISGITNFDINDYIGRNVTIHYEVEQGYSDKIVKSISLQSKKNEEVTFDFEDIATYDSSSIEYYTDESHTDT